MRDNQVVGLGHGTLVRYSRTYVSPSAINAEGRGRCSASLAIEIITLICCQSYLQVAYAIEVIGRRLREGLLSVSH